jgi:pyruvate formate lyase activating enzyme
MYDHRLCKNFKDCLTTGSNAIATGTNGIRIEWSAVQHPEKFRNVCVSRALTVSGEEKSISDILLEIEKDMPFYKNSKGGVTISGGEPMSQGSDMTILLQELRLRRIDVAVETSLHVPWTIMKRYVDLTGTFLADLKHTDKEKFKRFTGGDAGLVLANLRKLTVCHNNVIIRVPVITDFNHSDAEMKKIIDFSVSLKTVNEIHFLPFHNLGSEKYKMLGMEYSYAGKRQVDASELEGYSDYARSVGLIAKTGG